MLRVVKLKLSLKLLIMVIISFLLLINAAVYIITEYNFSRETLIDQSLEINRVYSQKMANTVSITFNLMQRNLQSFTEEHKDEFQNRDDLQGKLDFFRKSTNIFNSVIFIDPDRFVVSTSPKMGLVGERIDSNAILIANKLKEPRISGPYYGLTDKLLITVSTPVWGEEGEYLGLLAGTIYLQEKNLLQNILGKHFYENGSYMYVVDKLGYLIYHPEIDRVGELVTKNKVVKKVMSGKEGAERVINTKGVDMLAGYASVPESDWGVVSQTPTEVALAPLEANITHSILMALPFVFLSFSIMWWAASKIVAPINQLARYAENIMDRKNKKRVELPKLPTWYYETKQLHAILNMVFENLNQQLETLTNEASTDALTGLKNRRFLENMIEGLIESKIPFSFILLDIDHFKLVNDKYGHQKGDEVLRFISKIMKEKANHEELCVRYGGEEFVIILPNKNKTDSYILAESIRTKIEKSKSPIRRPVTLSGGIAAFPEDAHHFEDLLDEADKALYEAKSKGRNRIVCR